MKPLSQYDLLSKGLQDLSNGKRGVIPFVLGKMEKYSRAHVHIAVPRMVLLRARTFLDDLMELVDHEIQMTIEELIVVLYRQFLTQVRCAPKLSTIGTRILAKQKEIFEPKVKTISSFEQVSDNRWSLVQKQIPYKIKTVSITVSFHRKYIERGEIFLYDLRNLCPELDITVEQLITLLLLDFVCDVEKGNSKKVMERFIDAIEKKGD